MMLMKHACCIDCSLALLIGSLALPATAVFSADGSAKPPGTAGAAASSPAQGVQKDAPVVLSIFEVSGEPDEGYRSTQTLSGSRTLTNLRDTPNSISVINRELIDDLMATTVWELSEFSVTGEVATDPENQTGSRYVFRGIQSGFSLRDGVAWFVPSDTYALDRVEVLRGPQAFLYGEGQAGGIMNHLTKKAMPTNFERANLIVGSHDLYRIELDVNRRLNDKLSVRAAVGYEDSGHFQNHAGRAFKAGLITFNYRPFNNTVLNFGAEYGRNHRVMSPNMLADRFSTTDRTGGTQAYNVNTGGLTLLPAMGAIYDTATAPARRRSTGTGIVVSDEAIMPAEKNLLGPDAFNENNFDNVNISLDQRIFENLNIQASLTKQAIRRHVRTKIGGSSAGIYRDTNRTLPDGSPNPYFNELYTELSHRVFENQGPQHNARFTAVYDLELPFMTQRILGSAVYHDTEPTDKYYSEFVDPDSTSFKGSFTDANTLAAYQANRTVQLQNRFYRRFYLKDGDAADITKGGLIPGRSVMMRDIGSDPAIGRLADRLYKTPGHGIGAAGSYFDGRLHSLVGWRRDWFQQDLDRDFYNVVSGETYRLEPPPPTRLSEESINYGGVFHAFDFLSLYYNYAETVALSSGFGPAGLNPGTVRGPLTGDGEEMGLRWSLLDGRIESNWTYYITNATNQNANPAVPSVVRQDELGAIFDDIDPSGIDTQATEASGFEFETVTNLTPNWRLIWNFSTNELETSQRYPALKAFKARAEAQGIATPETDEFLASAPNGTPLPGFTKTRSNLVTNYRFTQGPLKGFSVGGSVQYREESYLGNFDLDRDGTAEELWTPGYTLYNLMLGYRTRIFDRPVNLALNVNNIFDKDYFRASSLASGVWGQGRSFRLAARIEL
jgi:outer membrane receptor protein involved in Fe transport